MFRKMISLLLTAAMLLTLAVPTLAQETVRYHRTDNDRVTATPDKEVPELSVSTLAADTPVRVSVVLEEQPSLTAKPRDLDAQQARVTADIEQALSCKLDVVWNLTEVANVISANVRFGDIEAIKAVPGVADVVQETRYEPQEAVNSTVGLPNMTVSSQMTGTNLAWSSGYTGAGMKVAIIDTGLDWDHQSMNGQAYLHAMEENAAREGKSLEQYLRDEQVTTQAELETLLPRLHLHEMDSSVTARDLYLNAKVPFAFNYVDRDLDVTHDNDGGSDHGSHVAGIAAANRYLFRNGEFLDAADTVGMLGNAPDAQIFVMKVFGKNGGAYDSDYMVAIEDAIVMGCDAVNLSLGSVAPGFTVNYFYQALLEGLTQSNTVVSISAGNSGEWAAYSQEGKLYVDGGVNFHTGGAPGTYPTALTVASVENDGSVGEAFSVAGQKIVYGETLYSNRPFRTLDPDGGGETCDYVFLDGVGLEEEYEGIDVHNKIVFVSRGQTEFFKKANTAVGLGAAAVVVYNTEPGIISMILTDYRYTNPVVMISSEYVGHIIAHSEQHDGYYTGTLSIDHKAGGVFQNAPFYNMSYFSSWGVPGDLSMKPEITAPGGNIYSLSGISSATDQYQLMSGTSMAAPQITGISAVVKQYIEENSLSQKGLTDRALVQSLLMSTAKPMQYEQGAYYPVLQQGAGLVDTGAAASADSFLLVEGQPDGKVKAELRDDPRRTGDYTVTFDLHNFLDQPQSYLLSGAFFTQKTDGTYLEAQTVPLAAAFSWSSEGAAVYGADDAYDFNGDGVTDQQDAQALLDYANAVRPTISHEEQADLSGDGKVTSYDVHLFLNRSRKDSLTVPAGGTVTVTARIELQDKKSLDETYPTGAYVEGYIFVDSLGDGEGKAGTCHSIPVLGYYGSWTDADMFDVGTYQTNWGGQEHRLPYLGSTDINSFLITYDRAGKTQFFGGNPILQDDRYYPERNAINSAEGDYISSLQVSPIRSGAAARIMAEDMTTGESLYNDPFVEQIQGAYFDVGVGMWMNAVKKVPITCVPAGMQEGSTFHAGYTLLPELYVDADDRVQWDQAGPGAHLDVYATVDNTYPQVVDVQLDEQRHELKVTVKDNQYIAGVLLYNSTGNKLLSSESGKPDAKAGENTVYVIDTSKINGSNFLLQVCDYARNITTFDLELNIGAGHAKLPMGLAYNVRKGYWVGFDDSAESGNHLTKYADSAHFFRAATMVDQSIFAVTDKGTLYVLSPEDLTIPLYVRDLGIVMEDMAYDPVTDQIYGLSEDQLYTIDKLNGQTAQAGTLGLHTNTLACDRNGVFYCAAYDSKQIYSFTLDTLQSPQLLLEVQMMKNSTHIQSMEADPDTGLVYWISHFEEPGWSGESDGHSPFYEIDPAAKTYRRLGDLTDEMAALVIQYDGKQDGWASPTDQVEGVAVSETRLSILKGNEVQLQAAAYPWTLTDRSVVWSSDDAFVASVDQTGRVQAHAPGICTIRAASALDGSVSASCQITVEDIKVSVEGILGYKGLYTMFFDWDVQHDEKWTPGVNAHVSLASATRDSATGRVFVADRKQGPGNLLHEVDPRNGMVLESAPQNNIGWPLWDLTVNPYFSTPDQVRISGITRDFLVTAGDPMDMQYEGIPFGTQMTGYNLAAVASGGYERVWDDQADCYRDTEHLYIIDDMGFLFDVWMYANDAGKMSAIIKKTASDFDKGFPGATYTPHMYCSMVVGENGYLYLSQFDRHTSNLYRLHYSEENGRYESDYLCNFGEGVWPAALFSVSSNDAGPAETVRPEGTDAFRLDAVPMTRPQPVSPAEASPRGNCLEKTAVVPLTADLPTTNGRIAASFDPQQLRFVSARMNGQVQSLLEQDGRVTVAFASRQSLAEELGELTFERLTDQEAQVTLTVLEENETEPLRTETVTLPAPVHDYEKTVVEPTCTEEGYTRYICRRCGDSYISDQVPALGHDWSDWTVTKEADCQQDGEERRTCQRCGEEETRVIPKTEHQYVSETKAPTCTEEGYTIHTCSVCGDSYISDQVPALGHDWSDWTVTKEADCQQEGEEHRTCQRCGEEETRVIPKTEHQYVSETKAPTCTEEGYTIHTCSVCGDSYISDQVPALGHSWGPWRTVKEADCFHDGLRQRSCSRCGWVEAMTIPSNSANCPSRQFRDLDTGKWYHQGVDFVLTKGLMNGIAPDLFGPYETVDRGQLVTMLYRLAGSPSVSGTQPFQDVRSGDYFCSAVLWAYQQNITDGVTQTLFAPHEKLTRDQMVTFLARYAAQTGVDIGDGADLSRFPDHQQVSPYAREAMAWAVEHGLIDGTDGRLEPGATAIRAQIAAVFQRYCEAFPEN